MMDPNMLYVEGFDDKSCTGDTLKYYIERISEKDVLHVTFGPSCNALVTVDGAFGKSSIINLLSLTIYDQITQSNRFILII